MKIIDKNRHYLKGTQKQFLHLATIHHSVREFICFVDILTSQIYIEEITGGHLSFIEDESLATELTNFLTSQGILNMNKPFLPDKEWYNKKQEPGSCNTKQYLRIINDK